MAKFFTLFVVSLVLGLSSAAFAVVKITEPTFIPAEQIRNMQEVGANFLLIDARPVEMFKEGHLPNAINVPAYKLDKVIMDKIAPELNKKLVFYCGGIMCPASAVAAAKAIDYGYIYVYRYRGGMEDWQKHNYKVVK